jgi:hypothetical protein
MKADPDAENSWKNNKAKYNKGGRQNQKPGQACFSGIK